MLRSIVFAARSKPSGRPSGPPKRSQGVVSRTKPKPLVATRAFNTRSSNMQSPIVTKANADPQYMKPIKPTQEELLKDKKQQKEFVQTVDKDRKVLEQDLTKEDFEAREQDDLSRTEYVNPATGERGGPKGYEPTKHGDWAKKGRVSDF